MPQPDEQGLPPAPPAVLVVDNDVHVLGLLRWALEDEGFMVMTASNGQGALEVVREQRPAVVVLDYTMAVIDGPRTAQLLRQACGEHLPVLLLSGDGNAARKAQEVRAYEFVRKPFDVYHLVAAVWRGLALEEGRR